MRNREIAKQRAKELVAKMTLEEKASQLKYDAPAIKHLGVPAYNWWNEALHGVARAGVATVFPQAIGMAAAFDTELLEEVASAIAVEGRAKYNAYSGEEDRDIYKGLTFWSPNVNIFRDPRWGRGHETYGEDPYLSGSLGVAFVKGLQGDEETLKSAACVKHFAVHSGPEDLRHEFDAVVSEKDLWETYLPAFETVVQDAQVEAVMGAYNRTNGEPCCGSKLLMQDILRDKWAFDGHYVSDCWAIKDFHEHHRITKDAKESAALALKMGCDLNCGNTYLHLLSAHQHGLITEEDITISAERLFTTRFLLGLFDEKDNALDKIPYTAVESPAHLALNEKIAAKSFVMLKNDGILPLDKNKIKTIGVIGPNANSRDSLVGNYHGTSSEYITVLEGIQRLVGDEVRVLYSEGSDRVKDRVEVLAWAGDRLSEARTVAKNSDVVILCLGLDEFLEGEEGDQGNAYASGDKKDLHLPKPQIELMETLASCDVPVVFCLLAGSDMDLSFPSEHFNAIMQLWYPGARGGKVAAEVLFGETSPSGKLPVTFYDNVDDLPKFTDYAMKNRTYRYLESKAQFPFGFGLTYGKVEMAKAEVCLPENPLASSKDGILAGVKVKALVKNVGQVDVEEVVQVYIKNTTSSYASLNPKLCGYQRVALKAGREKEVEILLDKKAFSVVNEKGESILDGKDFVLSVGFSQGDEKSVELMGQAPISLQLTLA